MTPINILVLLVLAYFLTIPERSEGPLRVLMCIRPAHSTAPILEK